MPVAASSFAVVFLRWHSNGLDAYYSRLKDAIDDHTMHFKGPVSVLSDMNHRHTSGAPLYIDSTSSEQRKIIWAFSDIGARDIPVRGVHDIAFDNMDRPDACVLQIRKHLASNGICKLDRFNAPGSGNYRATGGQHPPFMVQFDSKLLLHLPLDYSNPWQPAEDAEFIDRFYVESAFQSASRAKSDDWKPLQVGSNVAKPPAHQPLNRIMYRHDHPKCGYVHVIDVPWGAEWNDWIHIHEMPQGEVFTDRQPLVEWKKYQVSFPKASGLESIFNRRYFVPVVTANGKDGFRMYLFSPELMYQGHDKPMIRSLFLDLRQDGSIDSYNTTFEAPGGYTLELASSRVPDMTDFSNINIVCCDPERSDRLLISWENKGPQMVSIPINADGTIGDPVQGNWRTGKPTDGTPGTPQWVDMGLDAKNFEGTQWCDDGLVIVPNEFL
jgi:hypothetical protein